MAKRERNLCRKAFACAVTGMLLLGCISCTDAEAVRTSAADTVMAPLSERISNHDEVINSIRSGLRGRASAITVTFRDTSDVMAQMDETVTGWMEEALAETEHPSEGDYIRYQYGGYTYHCSYETAENAYRYTVRIIPSYHSYLSWEEQVDEAVAELMAVFGFDEDTPVLTKIETIYGYLCETVTYDKVRAKNPYNTERHTAYYALCKHAATCQGFCTALYRLLREAGVNCRIVTGEAENEALHAWVIAEENGLYYLLDPTWDAGNEDGYRYFMIGTKEDNGTHTPGEAFCSPAFQEAYPMAEESIRHS